MVLLNQVIVCLTVGMLCCIKICLTVISYLSAVIVIKLVSSVWKIGQVQNASSNIIPSKYWDVLFRLTSLMSSRDVFVPTRELIWAIDSEAMRARGIIVLVKSN